VIAVSGEPESVRGVAEGVSPNARRGDVLKFQEKRAVLRAALFFPLH